MNAGLSNLATLKGFVLPEPVRNDPQYDAVLTALGRGVLGRCERHCNRKFPRAVDDTIVVSAARSFFYVPRSPAEGAVAVALRTAFADDWAPVTIAQTNPATGLVQFDAIQGMHTDQLRFTWTGGYWFDALEPEDDGYPAEMPEGATPVEDDLRLAWLLMVQHVFERKDHMLPTGIRPEEGNIPPATITTLAMPEEVTALLRGFIRYQLT